MKIFSLIFLLLSTAPLFAQSDKDGSEVSYGDYEGQRVHLETMATKKADELVEELERIQSATKYSVDSTTALTVVKPAAMELFQELKKSSHGSIAYANFWEKLSDKLEDWDHTYEKDRLSGLESGSMIAGVALGILWGGVADSGVLGYILKGVLGLVGGPTVKNVTKFTVKKLGSRSTEKRITGVFFERLKERGLPVPRVGKERWLKKYLSGFVPDVMLLESPRALEEEILRFKQVLLDEAEKLESEPARQEILLGLADALPPLSGLKRTLRPKKWVKDSFAKLNMIKSSFVIVVEEMKLELGKEKAKAIAFRPIEVVKTKFLPAVKSNSLWIYFHPNTDFSRWMLQEYGATFMPLELIDLVESSEVTKIALLVDLKQVVEAKPGVAKGLYRLNFRFWFNYDVSVNVSLEFSSSQQGVLKIIQEGKWIENVESKIRETLEASEPFRLMRERIVQKRLCESNASSRLVLTDGDE